MSVEGWEGCPEKKEEGGEGVWSDPNGRKGYPLLMVLGGTTPCLTQAGKISVQTMAPRETRVATLEQRGVVPPHDERGGGGGVSFKKIGRGVGGFRFFVSGGYPPFPIFSTCGCCRLKSTGTSGWIYGAEGGYPLIFAIGRGCHIGLKGGSGGVPLNLMDRIRCHGQIFRLLIVYPVPEERGRTRKPHTSMRMLMGTKAPCAESPGSIKELF